MRLDFRRKLKISFFILLLSAARMFSVDVAFTRFTFSANGSTLLHSILLLFKSSIDSLHVRGQNLYNHFYFKNDLPINEDRHCLLLSMIRTAALRIVAFTF